MAFFSYGRAMLKYLIEVVQALSLPAVFIGLMLAMHKIAELRRGSRIVLTGAGLAVIAAAVLAWFKLNSNKINQEYINTAVNTICIVCLLILVAAFALIFFSRASVEGRRKILGSVSLAVSAAVAFTLLFYALPDVFVAPSRFVLADETIFSQDYLLKLIGYLVGILLCIVTLWCVHKVGAALSKKSVFVVFALCALVCIAAQAGVLLQFMLARRIIPMSQGVFGIVKFTVNFADFFIFLTLAVAALLPLRLIALSLVKRNDFENPALRRRYVASQLKNRRQSVVTLVLFLLCVLDLTVVQDYQNKGYTLAPAQQVEVKDGEIALDLFDIQDGHLHRYAYTSCNGVDMRFIVIKKNDIAFGVGLDACDICGSTGYYERNGQVVCMRCDVVMNISTIGYKGGCNPIPVEYSIDNGRMIIETDQLDREEKRFK